MGRRSLFRRRLPTELRRKGGLDRELGLVLLVSHERLSQGGAAPTLIIR